MRAFVESHPDLVHAEVNVSDSASQAIAMEHRIRAVPAYRLVDTKTQRVLFEQSGGAPKVSALEAEIEKWERAKSQ